MHFAKIYLRPPWWWWHPGLWQRHRCVTVVTLLVSSQVPRPNNSIFRNPSENCSFYNILLLGRRWYKSWFLPESRLLGFLPKQQYLPHTFRSVQYTMYLYNVHCCCCHLIIVVVVTAAAATYQFERKSKKERKEGWRQLTSELFMK